MKNISKIQKQTIFNNKEFLQIEQKTNSSEKKASSPSENVAAAPSQFPQTQEKIDLNQFNSRKLEEKEITQEILSNMRSYFNTFFSASPETTREIFQVKNNIIQHPIYAFRGGCFICNESEIAHLKDERADTFLEKKRIKLVKNANVFKLLNDSAYMEDDAYSNDVSNINCDIHSIYSNREKENHLMDNVGDEKQELFMNVSSQEENLHIEANSNNENCNHFVSSSYYSDSNFEFAKENFRNSSINFKQFKDEIYEVIKSLDEDMFKNKKNSLNHQFSLNEFNRKTNPLRNSIRAFSIKKQQQNNLFKIENQNDCKINPPNELNIKMNKNQINNYEKNDHNKSEENVLYNSDLNDNEIIQIKFPEKYSRKSINQRIFPEEFRKTTGEYKKKVLNINSNYDIENHNLYNIIEQEENNNLRKNHISNSKLDLSKDTHLFVKSQSQIDLKNKDNKKNNIKRTTIDFKPISQYSRVINSKRFSLLNPFEHNSHINNYNCIVTNCTNKSSKKPFARTPANNAKRPISLNYNGNPGIEKSNLASMGFLRLKTNLNFIEKNRKKILSSEEYQKNRKTITNFTNNRKMRFDFDLGELSNIDSARNFLLIEDKENIDKNYNNNNKNKNENLCNKEKSDNFSHLKSKEKIIINNKSNRNSKQGKIKSGEVANINRKVSLTQKVYTRENNGKSVDGKKNNSSYNNLFCDICLTKISGTSEAIFETTKLNCGHFYCRECICEYIRESLLKMNSRNLSNFCRCPKPVCGALISHSEIESILKTENEDNLQTFLKNLNTIETINNLSYIILCPVPDCGGFAKRELIEKNYAICSQNHKFCIKCLKRHIYGKCPSISLDEKATEKFIKGKSDFKKCPKCCTLLNKFDGCESNAVRCGYELCDYEFCWLCGRTPEKTHYTNPLSSCYRLEKIDTKHVLANNCLRLTKYFMIVLFTMLIIPFFIIFSTFLFITFYIVAFVPDGSAVKHIKMKRKVLEPLFKILSSGIYFFMAFALVPLGYMLEGLFILLSPFLFIYKKCVRHRAPHI